MRKNNAVSSYVSGVNKLSARENPFADDVSDDSKREITHQTAYVRPKYGAFAAAAVLIVFLSVGAVMFGQRIGKDSPAADSFESTVSDVEESGESSVPSDDTNSNETPAADKFTNAEDAINTYREADRQAQEMMNEIDPLIDSAHDIEALRNDFLARLMPLAKTSDAAVEFLKNVDTSVLLLNVYRHEGDDAVYLVVFNGLTQKIKFSGTAEVFKNNTGEKYTDAGIAESVAIEPKSIGEIRLLTDEPLIGELVVSTNTNEGDRVSLGFNFSEAVTTLSRERIAEITKILKKQ